MASKVITGVNIYRNEFSMGEIANSVAMDESVDVLDATPIVNTHRSKLAGLKEASIQIEGYQTTDADSLMFGDVGEAAYYTILPDETTVGSVAFLFNAIEESYVPIQGAVGEVAGVSVNALCTSDGLGRGQVLYNGTITADGQGSGLNIGAIPSGSTAVIFIHVLSLTGFTDVDFTIQSDSDNTWASPTSRATSLNVTAATARRVTISGAVTDTWFRLSYDVTGSGSVRVVASMMII